MLVSINIVALHLARLLLGWVGTNRLVVPSVGSWAFPVAAPRICNALPEETTSAQSLTSFSQHLKTWMALQTIVSRPHHLICPSQTV